MQIILSEDTRRAVIEKAVNALKKGGMVVYPADTVYGIAVDATNAAAIQKLDVLKSRKSGQKYSSNFSDIEMVKEFCEVSKSQEKILNKYLPGPFTFILSENVSVRIPKNSIIVEIVKQFGKPVTATSANISGKPPAISIKSLDAKIYLAADLLIELTDFEPKLPSAVVDISKEPPEVIRQGELHFP